MSLRTLLVAWLVTCAALVLPVVVDGSGLAVVGASAAVLCALTVAVLALFAEREGHTVVPFRHREGDVRLGAWVNTQRNARNSGALSSERVAQLEAFPGWTWSARAAARW